MDREIFLKATILKKKFIFSKEIISNMKSGGVSNIFEERASLEDFKITKNKILGLFWYLISIIRIKLKKIIISTGGIKLFFFIKKNNL